MHLWNDVMKKKYRRRECDKKWVYCVFWDKINLNIHSWINPQLVDIVENAFTKTQNCSVIQIKIMLYNFALLMIILVSFRTIGWNGNCALYLVTDCPLHSRLTIWKMTFGYIIGFGEHLNAQISQQTELLIWIAIARYGSYQLSVGSELKRIFKIKLYTYLVFVRRCNLNTPLYQTHEIFDHKLNFLIYRNCLPYAFIPILYAVSVAWQWIFS